jgi:transposase InsO family protein
MASSDFKIAKLTEDNFFTWVVEAEAALAVKGLWSVIEEDEEFRALDAKAQRKKQQEARGYLILFISQSVRERVIAEPTPKKMWEKLYERFSQKTDERKASLIEQLTSAEQKRDESVAAFVARVETLQRRLKEGHNEAVSDSVLMGILLKGISSKFGQTIEALRCLENLKLETVKDKLIAADERMWNSGEGSRDSGGQVNYAKGDQGSKQGSGRDSRRCYSCGKVGHVAKYCRQKTSKDGRGEKKCYECGLRGHLAKDCPQRKGGDANGAASSSGTALLVTASVNVGSYDLKPGKVLLDTGATHHMCHDSCCFTSLRPSSVSSVECGGGEKHRVLGQGIVTLRGSAGVITMHDVLLVPTLKVHLFSWPAASRKGAQLRGLGNVLEVIHHCRTVLRACAENGLFVLEGLFQSVIDIDSSGFVPVGRAHVAASVDVWHQRLGHVSYPILQKMQSVPVVTGMKVEGSVPECSTTCDVCFEGKQARLPFHASESESCRPLELVHSDVIGKMPCKSIGGNQYVLTIIDDYSRYSEIVCLKSKGDVASALWDVLTKWERQTGQKVKVVRTDGGTEYLGSLREKFRETGILHQKSTRYTPQQNGRAERLNRTLLEKTRCFMFQAKVPAEFWGEAVLTANHVRNLVPSNAGKKTPYELFTGSVPDLSQLRVFGCCAFVQVPAKLRNKLDKRSLKGILVGYEDGRKAWRVLCPSGNGRWDLQVSRDVQFVEHVRGAEALKEYVNAAETFDVGVWTVGSEDPPVAEQSEESAVVQEAAASELGLDGNTQLDQVVAEQVMNEEQEHDSGDLSDREGVVEQGVEQTEIMQPHRRRTTRVTSQPDRFDPAAYTTAAGSSSEYRPDVLTDEPKTLQEVQTRPDAELWKQAMTEELKALAEKGVYEYVDKPAHKTPLPAKWVFKIKRDERGAIEKYKARLVAKGFMQKPGVDYDEVFAPASSLVTLRLLLSIATQKDFDIHQLDVKTAFLNGVLTEEVYLRPPEGFEDKQGKVWLLKKALYGLKQAAQAWHATLKNRLATIGLKPSESDPCLYVSLASTEKTYVLIHVDDALIVGPSAAVLDVKSRIASLFEVHDLGEASMFLGLEIVRDRKKGTLWLGQSQYAAKKLAQFGMTESNSRVTPLDANQQLGPTGESLKGAVPYSEAVGSLLYLAVCTRPDLSHSVGMLSRFVGDPKDCHWHAVKSIMRYLRGTVKLGIMFQKGGGGLIGYSDSDYGGDLVKRRSTSGYVFLNAGGAILWGSKLQVTVATSTCEAELIAGAKAIKEALWLRKLMADVCGRFLAVKLLMDNQSALTLVKNPAAGAQTRSKHVDVQYNFARHRVITGDIDAQYVRTQYMIADVFTKQLAGPMYRTHRENMGMRFK